MAPRVLTYRWVLATHPPTVSESIRRAFSCGDGLASPQLALECPPCTVVITTRASHPQIAPRGLVVLPSLPAPSELFFLSPRHQSSHLCSRKLDRPQLMASSDGRATSNEKFHEFTKLGTPALQGSG